MMPPSDDSIDSKVQVSFVALCRHGVAKFTLAGPTKREPVDRRACLNIKRAQKQNTCNAARHNAANRPRRRLHDDDGSSGLAGSERLCWRDSVGPSSHESH